MNFQGEFNNSIDPKGRASIPAKFREVLVQAYGDETLMLTKNNDGGLSAYPLSLWDGMVKDVKAMPNGQGKTNVTRLVIAPAVEVSFDRQGRIQVPQSLRTYAEMEKDLCIVGMDERIELFSQIRYAEVMRKTEEFFASEQDLLADLGF